MVVCTCTFEYITRVSALQPRCQWYLGKPQELSKSWVPRPISDLSASDSSLSPLGRKRGAYCPPGNTWRDSSEITAKDWTGWVPSTLTEVPFIHSDVVFDVQRASAYSQPHLILSLAKTVEQFRFGLDASCLRIALAERLEHKHVRLGESTVHHQFFF